MKALCRKEEALCCCGYTLLAAIYEIYNITDCLLLRRHIAHRCFQNINCRQFLDWKQLGSVVSPSVFLYFFHYFLKINSIVGCWYRGV
ncbi:hypothetical protein TSUD_370470 [Trifolium subterraneum]|uniref:Uncharacterized protein n=1 Tax=Trifolium subterraneum TaxID=3900 RepID=A0A2Z6MHF9_TRISU|nr:hypothetical protein TSUD_370470 [Trifolium subterraneum]